MGEGSGAYKDAEWVEKEFVGGYLLLTATIGVLYADLASRDARSQRACLQRLWLRDLEQFHVLKKDYSRRYLELLIIVDGSQPEAELVGKIVARASGAVALDEGSGAEVFQAGTGGGQGLATAFSSGSGVHGEGIANPETVPPGGAVRNLDGLRVDRDDVGRRLANSAPGRIMKFLALKY